MLEVKVIDINQGIQNIEPMLRRLIGGHIRLDTSLMEGLGNVKADPGQLDQVLVNLVVNARDAMPDGGILTIETANTELDAGYARHRNEVTPGR
jgi:signal transduction histidine kinase